jgi:hypothetical protein
MPRKASAEKLEKVVSTKLSRDDYDLLGKYAKIRYNEDRIVQPTISHLLRLIIKGWSMSIRKQEGKRSVEATKLGVKEILGPLGY